MTNYIKIISKKELRKFGLLIGFGFPILIGWLIPSITGHALKVWTLYFGPIVLTMGLLSPQMLYYPFKVWMILGYALSWVNNRFILGLVFIVVLLPIALIMRLFGYDPLRLKKNGVKTFRENRKDFILNFSRIF